MIIVSLFCRNTCCRLASSLCLPPHLLYSLLSYHSASTHIIVAYLCVYNVLVSSCETTNSSQLGISRLPLFVSESSRPLDAKLSYHAIRVEAHPLSLLPSQSERVTGTLTSNRHGNMLPRSPEMNVVNSGKVNLL
jgi:hypothetical protein